MTPLTTVLQPGRDQTVRNSRRLSLRIPLSVPLVISDPRPQGFSECCDTIVASGHGCQLRSSRPLETGMQVRLDAIYTNRTTHATVIHSEPAGHEQGRIVWNNGLALDKPGNFWGVPSPPLDWIAANGFRDQDAATPAPAPGKPRQAPVHQEPPGSPARSPQDGRQLLSAIDPRIAAFEARLQRATAEFESGALARLQQSFGDAIVQARERIKRYATACGESRLVDLEAELERRLEPFLNRSQAAINDLERLLETLRQEHDARETRMAQWQQYGEQFQSWLDRETQQVYAQVHDAVAEASGQVKGRIAAITEAACEPMERRVRHTQANLETLVLRKTDELDRQCEANLERLHTVQEEMDRSFRVRLAAQQAEAIDLFQQQAKDVMGRAILRMYATLNEALGSTARVMQDQPSVSPTLAPGQDSAGSERETTADQ